MLNFVPLFFLGFKAGYLKECPASEGFEQDLVLAHAYLFYEVIRKLFENAHELGYAGPGDTEMVAR